MIINKDTYDDISIAVNLEGINQDSKFGRRARIVELNPWFLITEWKSKIDEERIVRVRFELANGSASSKYVNWKIPIDTCKVIRKIAFSLFDNSKLKDELIASGKWKVPVRERMVDEVGEKEGS